MSTIIFYTLSLSAMAVVIYIGARSIMKGFNAKNDNKIEKQEEDQNDTDSIDNTINNSKLTYELEKLNDLYKSGALTKEEFEKAKKDAAVASAATEATSCFDKEFANAGYSWDGTCNSGADACFVDYFDGTGIVVETSAKCSDACTGMVTEAQQEQIHNKCEKKSREKFIKSGGDATEFEKAIAFE